MKTVTGEWEEFRKITLPNVEESSLTMVRKIFYSGALSMLRLISGVLVIGIELENIKETTARITTLREECMELLRRKKS